MIITKSKFIITISFALFFCIILTNVGTGEEIDGDILYVDDDGTMDHISIQDAIDEASDGDTIFVNNGIYTGPIVINKQIKLIGLEKPIINEYIESGSTINIFVDNVTLDGFILQNNNTNNTKGVYITSNNNIITNCSIKNYFRGIYLYNSHNNIIQDNIIENNKVDGVDLIKSNYNNVQRNNIISNTIYGLNLWNANQNIIKENLIKNNQESGVYFSSSNNNSFLENNVLENKIFGISLNIVSDNNLIYYNNFVNNSKQQAEDQCQNKWYNLSQNKGNYWSDYSSLYANATRDNGIWSQPYNISKNGLIQDLYPLTEKYEYQDTNNEKINLLDDNDKKENISFILIFVLILICVFLIFAFWKKKGKK